MFFSDYNLFASNTCSLDLYSGYHQTTTVLFKPRIFTSNFTLDWLNSYYSSFSLSCPFIVLHKQSNECSWSTTLVFSSFREFHCDHIIVCVLCTLCCLYIVYTSLFVRSYTCLSIFLSCLLLLVHLDKFDVSISVYLLSCVKRYYIFSIFVRIQIQRQYN